MSNAKIKTKIIYSLQVHIQLCWRGYSPIYEMKNPHNPCFNCWVYEATPDFLAAFDAIIKGADRND